MTKLNTKEAARYREAEGHLIAAFGDVGVQCQWEMPHPKRTTFAMLAGFAVKFDGRPHYVILQIYRNGEGWEIFGCPSTLKIEPTFAALKAMWEEEVV